MTNKTIRVKREINVNRQQELTTFAANKEKYVGKFYCKDTMKVFQSHYLYTGRYPYTCPTGDFNKDNRYYLSLPGYDHPHIIMMDDFFYTTHIDLP